MLLHQWSIYQGSTRLYKFISRFFGHAILHTRPIGHVKQRPRKIKVVVHNFIYLLPNFIVIPSNVFAMRLLQCECCLNAKIRQFSYFRRIRLNVFRRICWKHGILLHVNSTTDTLITIYRKSFKQIFLRATPQILLIVALMVGLCLNN